MSSNWFFDMTGILDHAFPVDDDMDDDPETAACPQCGDTAYLQDDGVYVCLCGNEFDEGSDDLCP